MFTKCKYIKIKVKKTKKKKKFLIVRTKPRDSFLKELRISKLFSYKTLSQVSPQNQSLCIHIHQKQIFKVSPSKSNVTVVKRAHRARTRPYRQPFHLTYRYQIKEKYFLKKDGHKK